MLITLMLKSQMVLRDFYGQIGNTKKLWVLSSMYYSSYSNYEVLIPHSFTIL